MFYFFKIPFWLQKIYPEYLWKMPTVSKAIYLTFDDGPTPVVTEWVLEILKKFNAKATFFCEGQNVVKHPNLVKKVLSEKHRIGNHSFSHLNGWKTKKSVFIKDIEKATEAINVFTDKSTKNKHLLFRPPYGKITKPQAITLRKKGYKIVMLDVMSGDFDTSLHPERSLQKVIKHTKPGSIVVFHDYQKSYKTLQYVLPKALEFWVKKGFVFLAL